MKKIVVFFLVLAVFGTNFTLFAEDDEKQKLAVMEFEDQSGQLSKKMLSSATEYIRGAFVSTNKYVVIAKERQEKEMIKEMKKESYKACNDKNCQIPLGQALSADTILRTTITFFGGSYTITSELIDLEKEATIIGATQKFNGSEQMLMEALDKIVLQIAGKKVQKEKPVQNSQDHEACEYAKQDATVSTWKQYLDEFPNGECSTEAAEAIDKLACSHAEKTNSIEGWEFYLKHQSKGKCSFKAKAEIKKLKKEKKEKERQAVAAKAAAYLKEHKIGTLIWSDRSSNEMNLNAAKQYCANLSEGGYSDWRLPNIDELRTTIKNCSKTEPGGQCKVSEKNRCLAKWCKDNFKDSCECKFRGDNNGGYYSKLGDDNVVIWSSSILSHEGSEAWRVDFRYGGHVQYNYTSSEFYVRCVR